MIDFVGKFKEKMAEIDKTHKRTFKANKLYQGSQHFKTWQVYKMEIDENNSVQRKTVLFGLTEDEALKSTARLTRRIKAGGKIIAYDFAPEIGV